MRDKNLIFINNTLIENNSDQFSELVYHLKQNKEFNLSLIPIWQLFQLNNQGEIAKNDFKKYLTCVFKFLIHVLSKDDLEILAEEEILRLLTKQNKLQTVNFDQFSEIFAYLACKWVENVNLQSAQVFINNILERTTNIAIIDLQTGKEQTIQYNIEVQLQDKNKVQENFNAVQQDLLYDQIVYYEENVKRDEETIQIAKKDAKLTVKRVALNFKEIIPLGLSTETYIGFLVNNQFDSNKLNQQQLKHMQTQKIQNLEKVLIKPQSNESVIEDLKEYCEVEKAIYIVAVLSKGLENSQYSCGRIPRLNIKIQRPIFYELVKMKNKDEEQKVNILSEFLNNQELEIDEIDRLERKREEKLKRKKMEQELGEPYKKLIKKTQLNSEDYKTKLNFDLVRNVKNFQNKQENQEIIQSIKNDNIIFDTTNCKKELNFQEFSSKYNQIPRDTLQPFSQDIIEYANRAPLQILIHGKPKTGKTTFCREFAKMIDIVHIEPLLLIEKALNKIRDFEENPPEQDEDGNPKETLPEAIQQVKESLDNGKEVAAETILELVNLELSHFTSLTKGFILDLPLTNRIYEFSWIDAIIKNKVQLPRIKCRYFSHIVELKQSDEEVLTFMSRVMENGEIGRQFSKFDREALIKPKKKINEEGEGEGEEEEEEEEEPQDDEDEESKKPQFERDLAFLPGNEMQSIQELLQIYESKTVNKVSEFHSHLSINKHLSIPSAGLSPQELVQIAKEKLGEEVEPLRPLAVKLEGGSEKDALTVEGSKVQRQWSPWQQVDPVELLEKEKVVPGKGEFACGYAGRAFLFDSEENQNKFFENPQKYLKKLPNLPQTYNVAVVGPRCAGKKTYAKKLAEQYGWKLIDLQDIIGQKLNWQRNIELKEGHQPSNFEQRANDVHLNEQEWKEFSKGKEINVKDVWPIVLHKLGYKLQKKPEGWGVEKKEDEEDDEKRDDDEKKKVAKKPAKKAVKDIKKDDDERPQTPPVEDLSLKEIIQEIKEDGKSIETVKGVIIVGYPMNEEQINILKYHNIPIDKIISLVDTSEEEPGKVLNSRPGFEENYNLENELNVIQTANGVLKEQYGEENVKEVHIGGNIDEVYTRIRNQLDPFFIRADDEGMIRVQGDVNQEEEDNVVYGEYGPYCPVSLKDEGWLIPGKFDNPEKGESIEAYVQGKRHLFYGENEQSKFKENVNRYVQPGQRVEVPPPRVMFLGVRGAGLHTQLKLLQEKYKIPVLDFKANLQAHLVNEKIERRNDRLYNQVGFKPEEKEEIQDDEQEEGAAPKFRVIPNPEIEDENPEFDKKAHEIELTKRIFQGVREIFINGNFYKPVPPEDETEIDPFDQKMMPIEAELNELLTESKKLPEAIFYLQVSDEEFMKRTYDTVKQGLIDDYDAKKQAEREEKDRVREEAIAKRQQQIEEGVDEADLEPEPEEEEPEDPNAYQEGLDEILNAKKEELMNQKNSDQELLETLIGEFENLGIQVIPIQCNRSIDKVQISITYQLKGILEQRQNLLEKYQAYQVKRPVVEEEEDDENPIIDPLTYYEKSYSYKKSRYHDRNPLSLVDIPKCIQYPMIYRNRIYYFNSKEEIQQVIQEPLKYLVKKSFPNDIKNRPQVFVIGKPKVGKSTLAKLLEEKLNLVRIKPSQILEEFIFKHDYVLSEEARNCILQGEVVCDEAMVDLIIKRTQLADCVQNGFVLDGFPKNRKQAEIFTQKGILPTNVFSLQLDNLQISQRAKKQQQYNKNKFNYNDIILHEHIQNEENNILQTENYYLQQFNNIRFLDSKLSKWGIYDLSRKYILNTFQQRQNFARAQLTDQPVQINEMGFTHNQILHNLGSFMNISPVGLKINRQFFRNSLYNSKLLYFDRFIYVLNSDQEVQDFIERPDLYLYQKLKNIDVPRFINLGEIVDKYPEIQMNGFCYYTLIENQLVKGMLDIQCEYKGRVYAFNSHSKKQLFAVEPQRFANVKLPDKLPVNFSKINLVKKIAKAGKCTAYLEHHLGQIVMKVLAQLGYKRLKYPTINCKETALKFIGVSLKALNPNKDESYRKKYMDKLSLFLKHCQYSETITQETNRKNISWKQSDEEAFRSIASADEVYQLIDQVSSNDPWGENEEQRYLQVRSEYKNKHAVKLKTDSDRWSKEQEAELNNQLFEYKMFLANKKERANYWQEWDEENLLKITEEFNQFMEELQNEDKEVFFKKFIR